MVESNRQKKTEQNNRISGQGYRVSAQKSRVSEQKSRVSEQKNKVSGQGDKISEQGYDNIDKKEVVKVEDNDKMPPKKKIIGLLFGALTGFINGFFGGGGGMVAVPILTKYFGLEQKKAHATSIAVILPLTIASSIVYFFKINLNLVNTAVCAGGVLFGGVIGAFLLKKTNNKILAYIFYAIMLFAGIKMIF